MPQLGCLKAAIRMDELVSGPHTWSHGHSSDGD